MKSSDIFLFTQTYGDDRGLVFDWRSKDKNLNWFVKQFHNRLSFHNSSDAFVKEITDKHHDVWDEIVTFRDMSYTESFKKTIDYVKEKGFSKFIFMQDDVFSTNKDIELYEILVDFIKSRNFPMLNLSYSINPIIENDFRKAIRHRELIEPRPVPPMTIYEMGASLWAVSCTNYDLMSQPATRDSGEICEYFFDDTAFCCSTEFLDEIYDQEYFTKDRIWAAEVYLHQKFADIVIPRFCLNVGMFQNRNLCGRNTSKIKETLHWLENNFGNRGLDNEN
jgi:hypothetical protein